MHCRRSRISIEREQLEKLKEKIEDAINSNPILNKFKSQLLLDITSEGLRIQIVDEKIALCLKSGKQSCNRIRKLFCVKLAKC